MSFEDLSFDVFKPEPLLIVISGPSGVGKDSVLKALQQRDLSFHFVVTATSRAPRIGEINGVDYFFVTKEAFEEMIANNDLIEHSLVYNDYKGVPKSQIRQALASGKDTIMRVDVQGARKVRLLSPEAVLIFLVPHDAEEWYHRLKNRKTESEESLKIRMKAAHDEMDHLSEFDYVVVNAEDQLDHAVDSILAIITAEHHRLNHRKITL